VDLQEAQRKLLGHAPQPSPWLLESAPLWPAGGRALDVACGRGQNALLLAAAGFDVTAVDLDAAAMADLRARCSEMGVSLHAEVRDLEKADVDLGNAAFDLVVVFRYLHRPLFPALRRVLRPGGVLVYETFTRAQAALGHPRNPAVLLEEGELPQLVAPLEVLASDEGEREGSFVSRVVARRPPERESV
jgi:tellurite methyltransferase